MKIDIKNEAHGYNGETDNTVSSGKCIKKYGMSYHEYYL